jgi:hypothetical protein
MEAEALLDRLPRGSREAAIARRVPVNEASHAHQHATAWTRDLAAQTLSVLQTRNREQLQRLVWLTAQPQPEVVGAALISRLISLYVAGETPDGLAAGLRRQGVQTEDAHSLALVAVLMTRSGALPDPRWWMVHALSEHLAIAAAREAMTAGGAEAKARELLVERLRWPPDQAAELLQRARRPAGFDFTADQSNTRLVDAVSRYATSEEAK